jgi:hypothetical protein
MSGNDHVDRGAVIADRLGREIFAWTVFCLGGYLFEYLSLYVQKG